MQSPDFPSTPIEIDQLFSSFDALQRFLDDWSTAKKFHFQLQSREGRRVTYFCRYRNDGCQWRVSAIINTDGVVQINGLIAKHTCDTTFEPDLRPNTVRAWMRRAVPSHLWVTENTPPKHIMDICATHYDKKICYEQARLCRERLVRDRIASQLEQFRQIPGYLALLHDRYPLIYTHLATDSSNSCFQRVFICPHQAQTSFIQCRKLIAVAGVSLKSRFTQTLLLCAGIDANSQAVLLAWSIVESENKNSWEYFFHHLKHALPQILESAMISDRGKGLLIAADQVFGDKIPHAHCCMRLKEDFHRMFPDSSLLPFFWKIANSRTKPSYRANLAALREHDLPAAEYLASIDPKVWVTVFFPGRTYGYKSSYALETLDESMCGDKELSTLGLLDKIWHYTMEKRSKSLEKVLAFEKGRHSHTPYFVSKFLENRHNAEGNTVRMTGSVCGTVQVCGTKDVYLVNLEAKGCTCGMFQENGIPCQHAMQCIFCIKGVVKDHVPESLSVAAWKNTYTENWGPISLDEIPEVIPNFQAKPTTTEQPSQVSKQEKAIPRRRRTQLLRNRSDPTFSPLGKHCRLCGTLGHNSRTCGA